MNEKIVNKKSGARFGVIAGTIAIVLLVSLQIVPTPKIETTSEGTWHLVWQGSLAEATEADPGAGDSGFLEIFFINHSAIPDTAYAENDSSVLEGWADANVAASGYNAWANADEFLCQLRHSVLFDVVVRVRFNKLHAWDGVQFVDGDTRVNITLTGFNTAGGMSDIVGTCVVTYNNTGADFIYENWYWQDDDGGTGAGFSINKNALWSDNQITMLKIWIKY